MGSPPCWEPCWPLAWRSAVLVIPHSWQTRRTCSGVLGWSCVSALAFLPAIDWRDYHPLFICISKVADKTMEPTTVHRFFSKYFFFVGFNFTEVGKKRSACEQDVQLAAFVQPTGGSRESLSVNKQCTQTDTVYIHVHPNRYDVFSEVSPSETGWDNVQRQTFSKKQRQHHKDDTPLCFSMMAKAALVVLRLLHNKRLLLHGHKTVLRSHNKTLSAIKEKADGSLTGILIKQPSASVNQAKQWEESTFRVCCLTLASLLRSTQPPQISTLAPASVLSPKPALCSKINGLDSHHGSKNP